MLLIVVLREVPLGYATRCQGWMLVYCCGAVQCALGRRGRFEAWMRDDGDDDESDYRGPRGGVVVGGSPVDLASVSSSREDYVAWSQQPNTDVSSFFRFFLRRYKTTPCVRECKQCLDTKMNNKTFVTNWVILVQ